MTIRAGILSQSNLMEVSAVDNDFENKMVEAAMAAIVSAGEARDFCKEALQCARQGNFEKAEAKLKEAKDSITEAHNGQTEVIQAEMRGEETKISLLFIHAQDTIMTITSEINMATEMLEMYKLIHGKGGQA